MDYIWIIYGLYMGYIWIIYGLYQKRVRRDSEARENKATFSNANSDDKTHSVTKFGNRHNRLNEKDLMKKKLRIVISAPKYTVSSQTITLANMNNSVQKVFKLNAIEKVIELVEPKKELTFDCKNIYFNSARATLNSKSIQILNDAAKELIENPNTKIRIEGHTDNDGSATSNLHLSNRRAKALMDYLKKKGAKQSQMTYIGFGLTKPVATNTTDEGKAANRRAELKVAE